MTSKKQVIKKIMADTGLNEDFVVAIIYHPSFKDQNHSVWRLD